MAQRKIVLVRHGEHLFNSGSTDPALSSRGNDQARELNGLFDFAIISPLKRAKQTWDLSSMEAPYIFVDPFCRERIISPSDIFANEAFAVEPFSVFEDRVQKFKLRLDAWVEVFDEIVIVGHPMLFGSAFGVWDLEVGEKRMVAL